jgi:hypothetical protein
MAILTHKIVVLFQMTFNDIKAVPTPGIKKLPNLSDIFIAYSTVPGYVSHTEHTGSPFLIVLAKKLKELSGREHLNDILTRVKSEMSERDLEGKKQMPQVATTLTKDVLLTVVGKLY